MWEWKCPESRGPPLLTETKQNATARPEEAGAGRRREGGRRRAPRTVGGVDSVGEEGARPWHPGTDVEQVVRSAGRVDSPSENTQEISSHLLIFSLMWHQGEAHTQKTNKGEETQPAA